MLIYIIIIIIDDDDDDDDVKYIIQKDYKKKFQYI